MNKFLDRVMPYVVEVVSGGVVIFITLGLLAGCLFFVRVILQTLAVLWP